MTDDEIYHLQVELIESEELIHYVMTEHLPVSRSGVLYLLERIRILKIQLAQIEADLMKSLYRQIQEN